MIAKPGDHIIMIDEEEGYKNLYGKICVVVECDTVPYMMDSLDNCIWAHVDMKNHGGIFWTRHNSYEVIEDPKTAKVKVGDTIIVVNQFMNSSPNNMYCKKFGVSIVSTGDEIWAGGIWLTAASYCVIKRDQSTSISPDPCPDCNDTGRIELFTSVIDCDCVKKEQ